MSELSKRQRIWELDAFRGLCILCVILVHAVFDFQYFMGWNIRLPALIQFIMDYGGVLFVILSGVCVTLGSHSVRRGIIVLACGMGITAVTVGMVALNMAGEDLVIRFGVLQLLGVCMILYPILKRLPTWTLATIGVVIVSLGYWFGTMQVENPYLYVLGLRTPGFVSGDYFPLLPHLGWFLLGAVLGRTAYKNRRTLLPKVRPEWPIIRFFSFCGRQSLWIYLIHQPIVYGLMMLLARVL